MATELVAPVSKAALRRVYVSDLTPIDCVLTTGLTAVGGTATDGTDAINLFLQSATANSPVELIMDGGVATHGVCGAIAGHWSIVGMGWDTGFYQIAGSNTDVIRNISSLYSTEVTPTIPTGTVAYNIRLSNFFINGNVGTGYDGTPGDGNGNSTGPDYQGNLSTYFLYGASLMGVQRLEVDRVWFYNTSSFALTLSNCTDSLVQGCRFESPSRLLNSDGVHLNGGCVNTQILGCWFGTGDDAIAINCPEGNAGNISRVVVDSCIFDNCLTWCRPYTYTAGSIDSVLFSNCTGSTFGRGFNGSQSDGAGKTSFIGMSNCDITSPWLMELCTAGVVQVSNVRWTPSGSPSGFNLSGNVDSLMIDGLAVVGMTVPSLLNGGSTVNLRIGHLDPTNITALYSGVTPTISGPGVLPSGFFLPSSVMANWTPYIDSSSSLPSYKNASGTVVAL